jgi:hypothetical protein
MPHPCYPPFFHDFSDTWIKLHIMDLLIMQHSPASCYFIPQPPALTPLNPCSCFYAEDTVSSVKVISLICHCVSGKTARENKNAVTIA